MTQIPDFTALGSRPTPTPSYRRVQVDDSAAGVLGAVAGLGESMERADQNREKLVQQKAQADAATWASNNLTDFRVQQVQAMQDAQRNATDDAHGFTPGVLADFDQRASKLTELAQSNPLAGRFISKALPQLRGQVAEEAMRWEAGQRDTYRQNSVLDNTTKSIPIVQQDPSQRLPIGAQLLSQIDAAGFEPDRRAKLKEHVLSEMALAGANGDARLDPRGTLAKLADPKDQTYSNLSLVQREATQTHAKGELADQEATRLVNFFRTNGPDQGARALHDFNANPNTPDDVKEQIEQKVQAGVGLWQNEQRERHSQDLMGLMEKIGSGKADLNDRGAVFTLRSAGAISGEHAGSLLGEIDRQHLKKADDTVNITNALNAYRNSAPVDPKDQDMRKGMNDAFNALASNMQPGTSEWTNLAADMSRKTGMAPDYAIDWSRTKLVSGSNDEAVQASETIQRLQEANPRGIAFALDDKTKAMAANINKFVSGGADAPTAVARARQLDQVSPQEDKRLEEIYKAKGSKSIQYQAEPTLNKLIQNDDRYQAHGTGWFGTDFRKDAPPAAPLPMQAEFESNRADYFKMTGGDIQQADQLAYQDLKHKWGVTEVNGKREMMQYAPESMNPGLTTAYLREDMIKSAQAFIGDNQPNAEYIKKYAPELAGHYFTPEGQESKPWEKVHLVPDPEATEHSQGQLWQLQVPTANGFYAPLMSTGKVPARSDLVDLQVPPGSAFTDASKWDKRADGSQKGNGFLGLLRRPDGGVSSEISIGVDLNGKEQEIPLLVPTLTRQEVQGVLAASPQDPNFMSQIPASVKQKAVDFARSRIASGKSLFASPSESPGADSGTPGRLVLYRLPSAASSDQAARAAALDKARQDIIRENEAQKDMIAAQQMAAEQGGAF